MLEKIIWLLISFVGLIVIYEISQEERDYE